MSLPFDDGQHAPASADTVLAQLRITRLAANLPVHRAFHWLHLHQPQLRVWQLEFLAIAAPPFAESARATWFADRFHALGLSNVHLDAAGNALAELGESASASDPVVLLSAHLDTVFPAGVDTVPREDGPRVLAPGACDNGAGLTALLAIAASLRFAGIVPPVRLVFAANTGEEGEGDLRGMRHLFTAGAYQGRIRAALALEGSGTASAVTRALGSRRFRVTVSGPGGHSWTDAGAPNPITLLSRGLIELADKVALADRIALAESIALTNGVALTSSIPPAADAVSRTILSPGQIAGGTAINAIPAAAHVTLDLRSTDPAELDRWTLEIHRTFETIIADENRRQPEPLQARLAVEQIGARPAGELSANAPLMHALRAVDRHLGLRTELRLGSTDANLPLSLGVEAVALAAGGTGGGIHTLAEWYDPTGRETALRRILLLVVDAVSRLHQPPS